jgi:Electron transfer DM13
MPTISRQTPLALLAAPAVAAIVLTGVWVAGGVITDDYRTSMALTAAWFALTGAACVLIARRSRALRIPVIAAYILTAGAVGAYLGATTLRDDVVHERVITAAPAPPADRTAESGQAAAPEPGPVELTRGRFRSHEHATAGTARVIRDTDGRRYLTLTSFSTSAGPDLRVRLVPGNSFDGGAEGAIDLGALKGNRGDQQYAIPRKVDVSDHTVVIWCRAFSAPFGSAGLRQT